MPFIRAVSHSFRIRIFPRHGRSSNENPDAPVQIIVKKVIINLDKANRVSIMATELRKGKERMIEIPAVDERTDLPELRQILQDAAKEAELSATALANTEGKMIADHTIPPSPLIGNTGFRDLLKTPPTLGTWKVLRARLVVKAAIQKALKTAAQEA